VRIEKFVAVATTLRQAGAELTTRAAVASGDEAWLLARHSESTLTNPIAWESGGLLTIVRSKPTPNHGRGRAPGR